MITHIGVISLECYLLHESLVLHILATRFIHNNITLLIISIFVTVILATILHVGYSKFFYMVFNRHESK
jgi:hypothetical protein